MITPSATTPSINPPTIEHPTETESTLSSVDDLGCFQTNSDYDKVREIMDTCATVDVMHLTENCPIHSGTNPHAEGRDCICGTFWNAADFALRIYMVEKPIPEFVPAKGKEALNLFTQPRPFCVFKHCRVGLWRAMESVTTHQMSQRHLHASKSSIPASVGIAATARSAPVPPPTPPIVPVTPAPPVVPPPVTSPPPAASPPPAVLSPNPSTPCYCDALDDPEPFTFFERSVLFLYRPVQFLLLMSLFAITSLFYFIVASEEPYLDLVLQLIFFFDIPMFIFWLLLKSYYPYRGPSQLCISCVHVGAAEIFPDFPHTLLGKLLTFSMGKTWNNATLMMYSTEVKRWADNEKLDAVKTAILVQQANKLLPNLILPATLSVAHMEYIEDHCRRINDVIGNKKFAQD